MEELTLGDRGQEEENIRLEKEESGKERKRGETKEEDTPCTLVILPEDV